jgi:hypothetical protein
VTTLGTPIAQGLAVLGEPRVFFFFFLLAAGGGVFRRGGDGGVPPKSVESSNGLPVMSTKPPFVVGVITEGAYLRSKYLFVLVSVTGEGLMVFLPERTPSGETKSAHCSGYFPFPQNQTRLPTFVYLGNI